MSPTSSHHPEQPEKHIMEIIIDRNGNTVNGKTYDSEEAALTECDRIVDSVRGNGMAGISLEPREVYIIRVCRNMAGEAFVQFESGVRGMLARVTDGRDAASLVVEQVQGVLRRLIEQAPVRIPQEIGRAFDRLARDEAKNRETVREFHAMVEQASNDTAFDGAGSGKAPEILH